MARGGMVADSFRVAVVAAFPLFRLGGLPFMVSLVFVLMDFYCVISCFSLFFSIGFLGGLHLCEDFSLVSEWTDLSVVRGAPAAKQLAQISKLSIRAIRAVCAPFWAVRTEALTPPIIELPSMLSSDFVHGEVSAKCHKMFHSAALGSLPSDNLLR